MWTDLDTIVESIAKHGKVGTLTLGRRLQLYQIFFERDGAYLLQGSKPTRISLAGLNKLSTPRSPAEILDAAGEARRTERSLPEILMARNWITPSWTTASSTLYSQKKLPRLITATTICDLKASLGNRCDLSFMTNATPNTLSNCPWSVKTTNNSGALGSNLLDTK